MKNQLLLFESDQVQTPPVAVLEQLPPDQREVATQLLAELMARSLADGMGERGEVGVKEGADE
jgi:hypothetical protein